MLKKMQWHFIGATMLAISTVIFILLCFINISNYQSITSSQDDILRQILEFESNNNYVSENDDELSLPDWSRYSREVQYSLRFFSVYYDENKQITKVNQNYITSLSNEELKDYSDSVLNTNKTSGYKDGYRYLISENDDQTIIIFLNSEREIQMMKSLLLITLIIALVCILVIFGLVILFSKKAIKPYSQNLEAQRQFITNAGHELKTPLTAIMTSADVLNSEYGQDEWIDNIQTQANRLSKLITNLITLSRIDEENPFISKVYFCLSDILKEVCDNYSPIFKAKDKTFKYEIEDNLYLTGDKNAIRQSFIMLLDNALKYSNDKGYIYLKTNTSHKKILINITNSIDPDYQIDTKRIFDRFYREDKSHSNTIDGSGIGLSIVKATIQGHKGKINATKENNLITFKIIL